MSDSYERTFTVSVPAARAFQAFTDPADLEMWFAERFDTGDDCAEAMSVGGPMHFDPIEIVPEKLLHYKQWAESPEAGIEVTVVFESNEHGTRITFTQSGFGGPTRFQTEPVHNGMNETLDDLILYLEHGVAYPRHRDVRSRCGLGAEFARVPGGLRITDIHPDGFAAAAGIEPGDIVLQLGQGAVFDHHDIAFFVRDHEVGDEADVVYARAGEVRRRRARLSAAEHPRWSLTG